MSAHLHQGLLNSPQKPIYLLADSRPLFWRKDGLLFLKLISRSVEIEPVRAAYLGASNGDNVDYYSLFEASMQGIGVYNCRMIRSSFPVEDASFIDEADIILLAGGDVGRGCDAFRKSGLDKVIVRRYDEGAILIGISAGAVQLGLSSMNKDALSGGELFETLKLVPFMVGVHDEAREWAQLKAALSLADGDVRGIGIPHGAGVVYHADRGVEPLRHPIYKFSKKSGQLTQCLLFPQTSAGLRKPFEAH